MEKLTYLVAEGVPFVNGSAVPEDRRVVLTAAEAAFDLALSRIEAEPAAAPNSGNTPSEPPADPEEGDGKAPAEPEAAPRGRR